MFIDAIHVKIRDGQVSKGTLPRDEAAGQPRAFSSDRRMWHKSGAALIPTLRALGCCPCGRFAKLRPPWTSISDLWHLAIVVLLRGVNTEGAEAKVQPYLDAVDTHGTAVLFLAGRFSHAIRKAPLLTGPHPAVDGLLGAEAISPRQASGAELETAEAALAAIPTELDSDMLYARIDLIPDPDGRPVLLELELSEPSLFLAHADGAAARLAAAIGTHLDRVLKTR